jgi:hypothetical protein
VSRSKDLWLDDIFVYDARVKFALSIGLRFGKYVREQMTYTVEVKGGNTWYDARREGLLTFGDACDCSKEVRHEEDRIKVVLNSMNEAKQYPYAAKNCTEVKAL